METAIKEIGREAGSRRAARVARIDMYSSRSEALDAAVRAGGVGDG